MRGFVDVHSHMVPAGDDGVKTIDEGLELLRETARRGTAVQYATPHATTGTPWTPERDAAVRERVAAMNARARGFGLELRLGWEISPQPWALDADLTRLRLEGLDAVLLELPLPYGERARTLELFFGVAEAVEAAGLVPILGHPERSHLIHPDREVARELAGRGWPLQVNASSLVGRDGATNEETGWWLVESGLAALVASDGHRAGRPPYLDGAYAAVADRVGEPEADRLFGGDALVALEARELRRTG